MVIFCKKRLFSARGIDIIFKIAMIFLQVFIYMLQMGVYERLKYDYNCDLFYNFIWRNIRMLVQGKAPKTDNSKKSRKIFIILIVMVILIAFAVMTSYIYTEQTYSVNYVKFC